jgi:hypothetical protein
MTDDWPNPSTVPPVSDEDLAERLRLMQRRIIIQLSIEIDVCRRTGIALENREHELEVMLKAYGIGGDDAVEEGQEPSDSGEQYL